MTTAKLLAETDLPIDEIDQRDRLRPVSAKGVEAIVASVRELGVIKDPIHVRKKRGGSYVLMAGGHRLAAARELGMKSIRCRIWQCTDDWAQLMEIDDNLASAELTALDTAVFLAARKSVYEKMHPETVRGIAGAAARWNANDIVSFASVTAEKFGLSRRQVERIAAAGDKLRGHEAGLLRKAPRPITLKDLTVIAKIAEPVERYDVVEALSAGTAKSAAEARKMWAARENGPPAQKDPVEAAFNTLRDAWRRAPKAARRRFLEVHGSEVEDLLFEGREEAPE